MIFNLKMEEFDNTFNMNLQDIEEYSLSQNNILHSVEFESRNNYMTPSYLFSENIINPLNFDSSIDMNQTEENEDIKNENNSASNKISNPILFNVDHSPENNLY